MKLIDSTPHQKKAQSQLPIKTKVKFSLAIRKGDFPCCKCKERNQVGQYSEEKNSRFLGRRKYRQCPPPPDIRVSLMQPFQWIIPLYDRKNKQIKESQTRFDPLFFST